MPVFDSNMADRAFFAWGHRRWPLTCQAFPTPILHETVRPTKPNTVGFLDVRSLPPQRVDRQLAGGAVKPAGRVFRHAAPRPGFQGLHERGLDDVLDEVEPAHTERPSQHGDEPAEFVAKKVLHQRARFAHAYSAISQISGKKV